MERFAEVRAVLRKRGDLIPEFEIVVGPSALHYVLTVVANDQHFAGIPNLKIYQRRKR